MKLQDKKHEHPPFDCAAGMAAGLLATGNFEKAEPLILRPAANTRWFVKRGLQIQDYEHVPEIVYRCEGCGLQGTMTGPTCHKTQKLIHCNIAEPVPEHIQKEYLALRASWEKKFKPRQVPGTSSAFDRQRDAAVHAQRVASGEIVIDPVFRAVHPGVARFGK